MFFNTRFRKYKRYRSSSEMPRERERAKEKGRVSPNKVRQTDTSKETAGEGKRQKTPVGE